MSQPDEEYETHDIYLAAYLKLAGCEQRRRRKQGHRYFFVFSNPGGSIKDLREAYFSGSGVVSASKYADEIRRFKELCFD